MTQLANATGLADFYIQRSRLELQPASGNGSVVISDDLTLTLRSGETTTVAAHARDLLQTAGQFTRNPDWHNERDFADAMFVLGAAVGAAVERAGRLEEIAPQIGAMTENMFKTFGVTHG